MKDSKYFSRDCDFIATKARRSNEKWRLTARNVCYKLSKEARKTSGKEEDGGWLKLRKH
jgi:hypothetical protein